MDISDLTEAKYPLFQAPMAGASNPTLVAAVSNAGAVGGLGAAATNPDALRTQIREIKSQTAGPFVVNLFAPASEQFDDTATASAALTEKMQAYYQELNAGEVPTPGAIFGPAEDQLAVLIEEQVPIISFHFGIEAAHIEAIHAAGLKAICSATTVKEAKHLESLGIDSIIAQGSEAGGHRGTYIDHYRDSLIGTLALVPQIVDAVSVPVIAAGGIMDARGIVACRALGASAVQLGTAFLACPETGIPTPWRETLLNADGQDTTVTTVMSGKPARGIRNRYITELEAMDEPLLPYPLQYALSGPLRRESTKQGNTDFLSMWSGQGVGLIKEMSAAELVISLMSETDKLTKSLAT